jgi:hypothetical protein
VSDPTPAGITVVSEQPPAQLLDALRLSFHLVLGERPAGRFHHLLLGGAHLETEDADHLLCQDLRKVLPQQRHDDVVTGEKDVFGTVLPHDPSERFHDVFRVMQVVVLDVPLVSHLRPAARVGARKLLALHVLPLDRAAAAEHEDARVVRVGKKDRVARVAVHDAGEWIKVRSVADGQAVPLDRRIELERLEEVGGRAGEDRDCICGGADVFGHVTLDPRDVLLEAFPLGRPELEIPHPAAQLLAEEGRVVVLAAAVRLCVQVEADDGETERLAPGEALESFGERRGRCGHFHRGSFRRFYRGASRVPGAHGRRATIESDGKLILSKGSCA